MSIVQRAVRPLQLVLVLTFALLVLLQTMSFPGQFAHMAKEHPDMAYLRWPLTAFAVVEILCVQVVIVCTWTLLSMVQQERIFTEDALRRVDVMIGAIWTGWLILAGTSLYLALIADDPGGPILLLLMVLGGGAFGLLMLVMRELLRQATSLRTDMEAVI